MERAYLYDIFMLFIFSYFLQAISPFSLNENFTEPNLKKQKAGKNLRDSQNI